MQDKSHSNDSGAVIVYITILLGILITSVFFLVELRTTRIYQSEQLAACESMALAALRTYESSIEDSDGNPLTPLQRLELARTRAQDIAQVNVFLGDAFLLNHTQDTIDTNRDDLTDESGSLIPGIWHYYEPTDSDGFCEASDDPTCPCDDDGNWAGPCFQEVNLDQSDPPIPNAFRARLFTRPGEKSRYFYNILGRTTSQATAATAPLRGVFLVDLSRSSVGQTHRDWQTVGKLNLLNDPPCEYAFRLSTSSCPAGAVPCPNRMSCDFTGGDGFYRDLFNYWKVMGTLDKILIKDARPGDTLPTIHYKNDYTCYEVDDNGTNKAFIIDTYTGDIPGGGFYDGPEPLTSALDAINYALSIVEDRAVTNDLIAAIGFDQEALHPLRTFPLLAVNDQTTWGTVENTPARLKMITDIENQHVDLGGTKPFTVRAEGNYFFPREDANTNIPVALSAALDMLTTQEGSESASSFVVLISDGLSNCTEDRVCERTTTAYKDSIDEALNIVLNDYTEHHVKLHVILAGTDVNGAHTLIRKKDDNKCMTDDDVRTFVPTGGGSVPMHVDLDVDVNGDPNIGIDVARASSSSYFHYSNRFWEAASATRGLFLTIRPACDSTLASPAIAASGCTSGELQSYLDDKCAQSTADPGSTVAIANFTDSSGRLLCDPSCGDIRTQMRTAIDEIMSQTPYRLVEESE